MNESGLYKDNTTSFLKSTNQNEVRVVKSQEIPN